MNPSPEVQLSGSGERYGKLLSSLSQVIADARRASVRAVNAYLTSAYWLIGRHIVEYEQGGEARAQYGDALLTRLARDLTPHWGRGFSQRNLALMRSFYQTWPIVQTLSAQSLSSLEIPQTVSAQSTPEFPLPWSHYVRLLSVPDAAARQFYEQEALRGGWSVRQLDRQVGTRAYERGAGRSSSSDVVLSPDEHVRDPFVLEFLNLKEEYSESDLEAALIRSLETFLLELGNDFTFVARQKRLRVGHAWYRVDLVFFHRLLRCLVIVDLKIGTFTHADAGQMNLYLNYAREHWTHPHENPPVGLILCSENDTAVAHYALGNLQNQVLAREYELALPKEPELAARIESARRTLLASPSNAHGRATE